MPRYTGQNVQRSTNPKLQILNSAAGRDFILRPWPLRTLTARKAEAYENCRLKFSLKSTLLPHSTAARQSHNRRTAAKSQIPNTQIPNPDKQDRDAAIHGSKCSAQHKSPAPNSKLSRWAGFILREKAPKDVLLVPGGLMLLLGRGCD